MGSHTFQVDPRLEGAAEEEVVVVVRLVWQGPNVKYVMFEVDLHMFWFQKVWNLDQQVCFPC